MDVNNIPLDEFDKQVYRCVNEATGQVKCSALSAYIHLDKAWLLSDVDLEMSIFRAITAEEEMATSIFIALRNLGYSNAKQLNPKNHIHKQGLFPFCNAIWRFLDPSRTSDIEVQLYIEEADKPKVKLRFLLPGNITLTPEPPLNQKAMQDDSAPYKFESELKEYAETKGVNSIETHLTELAKLRNSLLYANNNVIPSFQGSIKEELLRKTQIVLNLARLLCLIFPFKTRSTLVQQCINIYLNELPIRQSKRCERNE